MGFGTTSTSHTGHFILSTFLVQSRNRRKGNRLSRAWPNHLLKKVPPVNEQAQVIGLGLSGLSGLVKGIVAFLAQPMLCFHAFQRSRIKRFSM